VEESIAKGVGDRGFPHGGVPVFGWELAGEDGGGASVAILDDFEEVGAFLVKEGRQEDVIDNEELGLGEFGEELEARTVSAGLVKLFQEPGGADGEDGESLAGGKIAEGAGDPGFSDACGPREEDVASGGDPARVGQFQKDLFLKAPGVSEVDVLDAGVGMTEPRFFEEPSKSAVVAVGLFILNEKTDKFIVGEVGVGGVFETVLEAFGHAEELEVVEGGQRLFEHHG